MRYSVGDFILFQGLHFIISCNTDSDCKNVLSNHSRLYENVKVGSLEYTDRAKLVRQFFGQHGKSLDESAFNNQV